MVDIVVVATFLHFAQCTSYRSEGIRHVPSQDDTLGCPRRLSHLRRRL
jgi:hypothetical protein